MLNSLLRTEIKKKLFYGSYLQATMCDNCMDFYKKKNIFIPNSSVTP